MENNNLKTRVKIIRLHDGEPKPSTIWDYDDTGFIDGYIVLSNIPHAVVVLDKNRHFVPIRLWNLEYI